MKENLIAVDLSHGEQPYGKIFDSTGHGYSVYYTGENQSIRHILKAFSAWGGPSNKYKDKEGTEYLYFEFSFEDFKLFEFGAIERLLRQEDSKIQIKILRTNKDVQEFWGFFK